MTKESTRTLLPNDKFVEFYWSGFEKSSFRLETLDSYGATVDDEMFSSYLAGGLSIPKNEGRESWCAKIKEATESGKEMSRIHIVPTVLTPYLRYEIEWGYTLSTQPSGENIFLVNREANPRLAKLAQEDFYLLDDKRAIVVVYDENNSFLRTELEVGEEEVAAMVKLKEDLMAVAIPLSEYLKKMRTEGLAVKF